MRTFSEIVDALADNAQVAHKPISQLAIYVNNAITEINIDNRRAAWDTVEYNINLCDLDTGNRWFLPADFLGGMEVRYDRHPDPIPHRKLGSTAPAGRKFWYQSERYIVFSGEPRHSVQIAYQRLTPFYKYFPPDRRLLRTSDDPLAIFDWRPDPEADWVSFQPNNPQMETSYRKHTNWVIEKLATIILTGAKSYLYNETGNLAEGGRLYNNFIQQLQKLDNFA